MSSGSGYQISRQVQQTIVFILFFFLSLVLFQESVWALLSFAIQSERYTHIILIPLISLFLVCWERDFIFLETAYSPRVGLPFLLFGILFYYKWQASASSLPMASSAMILFWVSGFILCYGTRAGFAARFPLCFLLLMIPLPASFMDGASAFLQHGSAEMTSALFNLIGVPVFRQGFTFTLPGVSIEIAEECSGIRSSIALVITSVLAGHVFLQSGWKKLSLILVTIPITIFKNAVRIALLACLGVYVDRDFLTGDLHHRGGALFSIVALAIFLPLLGVLYKSENRAASNQSREAGNPSIQAFRYLRQGLADLRLIRRSRFHR